MVRCSAASAGKLSALSERIRGLVLIPGPCAALVRRPGGSVACGREPALLGLRGGEYLPAICAELHLHACEGVPLASSRDVAEFSEKRHDHVLQGPSPSRSGGGDRELLEQRLR